MDAGDLTAALKLEAARLGFAGCAISSAEPLPATRAVIEARIARGSYDGLPWFTAERAARIADPATTLDGAGSVITLAAPYRAVLDLPAEALGDEPRGRVARYAWGRDYHRALRRPLRALLDRLGEWAPGAASRVLVDAGPLAERAVAARAGLGWFGKSTNLLVPGAGSWVLLSEIVTTVSLIPDEPLRKTCGACIRCVAACPTDAIVAPYDMDNGRCISFQTIEQRGPIPRSLRPLLGDWLFGCDVCQDACPVPSRAEAMVELRPATADDAAPPLIPLLSLTEDTFRARFAGRPIIRAKRDGLLRNACIALANLGDDRAVPPLTRALSEDRSPLVRGHAAWALGRLSDRRSLDRTRSREVDPFVLEEIEAALAGEDADIAVPPKQPLRAWMAGERLLTSPPTPPLAGEGSLTHRSFGGLATPQPG